ncbi:class I SAM-dependent methyltransferase [Thermocrinis minervae]|uniref:Methyltransferase domain-containing protein n=1 Tax=Thermocrinis minervae TaxID=381751 RepID=A0A1M6QJP6_9AQUI|nr:class I SAM-dependent methyltransferase [Thermocrinis minervae]SHK20293.1 Methyltransferase domain-containing protein [Thermocrinis minervae]
MAHKFDPQKLSKLDDPARLELFDPVKVFREFGLREGMHVLDVGTGAGFYLPYISSIVGPKGKVYAIDVQQEAVDYARKKVESLGLQNVEVLKSEENSIPLPEHSVDFVLMTFVFHELSDPITFLKELERVAKPFGYLAIIDWKKEERDKGPPPEEVYSEWEVGLMLEEAGLKVGRVIEVGKYCFGVYALFPDRTLEERQSIPIKIPPGLQG